MAEVQGSNIRWRKSSACAHEGCLEIAANGDRILLRRSEAPLVVLEVPLADWDLFVGALRRGEFESLADAE